MLMLVVTIIIAAVVSAFAGGLTSNTRQAPSISAQTSITNTGYFYGSQFRMVINSVSEPIPTSNLRLVTSWTNASGVHNTSTVLPNVTNVRYSTQVQVAPLGTGNGVSAFGLFDVKDPSQYFGNYTLAAGTVVSAYPAGSWGPTSVPATYGGYGPGPSPTYIYVSGTGYTVNTSQDAMQAVLGYNWNSLRTGDVVNVRLIHTPSQKVIYEQNVVVQGA